MSKFRFEELEIWEDSIKYGISVYNVTKLFPSEELYGLSSQLRRASISISSNIAEGSGSSSVRDFCKFLDIAIKSTLETVSQLRFAQKIGYIEQQKVEKFHDDAEILIRRIRGFKKYLSERRPPTSDLRPERSLLHG
jgi:four helix bundle protein